MAGFGAPPGNNYATKSKPFLMRLAKLIAQEDLDPKVKTTRLDKAASELLTQASLGVEWAIKELANRIDGKAVQGIEVSPGDGTPLNFFDPANLRNLSESETVALQELLKKAAL